MTRSNIFPLIFMIGISLIPVLSVHMPRSLSFTPLLLGLVMSIWWAFIKKEKLIFSKSYIYSILGICAICIISSLWSIEPMDAYKKALKVSAILILSIPLFSFASSVRLATLKPYLWLFPMAVTLAALLCSFELVFNLPIYQLIHAVEANYEVNTSALNPGIICVTFSYFAALLFISHMDVSQRKKYLAIAIMSISLMIMLSLSQSQSGQLAFILGGVMLLLFPHKRKRSCSILALLIIGAMLLTPFIVNILFDALIGNAQEIPWLKDGYAGNRIEIWEFVMRHALNSPFYGHGIEATRYTEFEHGYIYHRLGSVLHPHNFSIQLWMEFGIIGVLAASTLITLIMKNVGSLTISDKKVSTSLFIAILTVSAMGYGMWQSWWLGLIVFLIAICCAVAKKQD